MTVTKVKIANKVTRRSLQGVISKVISNGLSEFFKPLFIRNRDRVSLCPLLEVRKATCDVLGRSIDELTFITNIEVSN